MSNNYNPALVDFLVYAFGRRFHVSLEDVQNYLDKSKPVHNPNLTNVDNVFFALCCSGSHILTIDLGYNILQWLTNHLIYRGLQLHCIKRQGKIFGSVLHLTLRASQLWTRVLLDRMECYNFNVNTLSPNGDSLLRLAVGLASGQYRDDPQI